METPNKSTNFLGKYIVQDSNPKEYYKSLDNKSIDRGTPQEVRTPILCTDPTKVNPTAKIHTNTELAKKLPSIREEDMPSMLEALVAVCKENKLFLLDSNTGLIKTPFAIQDKPISIKEAQNLFRCYFRDKIGIKQTTLRSIKFKSLTSQELDDLFLLMLKHLEYNSRSEEYNKIPEWDGNTRISSFLKDYYNCDAPCGLFWLFMTAFMGKLKDSEKTYVPYFFDFVGEKGVGKTYGIQRICGEQNVGTIKITSRREDMLVNIYSNNLVVVIDDECCLVGKVMSYDEFKSFVTEKTDVFSRKFQQPETHTRNFIITRTSNEIRTVFSPDERRQIIFNIGLSTMECRIKDLDEYFFEQLRAEAKAYYEEHGVYKLTHEDEEYIRHVTETNYNDETPEVLSILNFIKSTHKPDGCGKTYKVEVANPLRDNAIYCTWANYEKWRRDQDLGKEAKISSRDFWRSIKFLVKKYPDLIFIDSTNQVKLKSGNTARVFGIYNKV